MTEWRTVPGFEAYEVSDTGLVRNSVTKRIRKQQINRGYAQLTLAKNGWQRLMKVHRLVAMAFVEGAGEVVRHLDGDALNNRADNLAWGTQSENNFDAVRHGTHANARKTHCKRGHAFTPENTEPTGVRGRRCRTCRAADIERAKAKRRERNGWREVPQRGKRRVEAEWQQFLHEEGLVA